MNSSKLIYTTTINQSINNDDGKWEKNDEIIYRFPFLLFCSWTFFDFDSLDVIIYIHPSHNKQSKTIDLSIERFFSFQISCHVVGILTKNKKIIYLEYIYKMTPSNDRNIDTSIKY